MDGRKHRMGQFLQRNALSYLHLRQLLNLLSVDVVANVPLTVPARKITCHVQHFANAVTVVTQ